MSHFSVAVISNDNEQSVEELLAPYQENNMGDCPSEFLEFEELDSDTMGCIKSKFNSDNKGYNSLNEFIDGEYGYDKNSEGKYGYYENPNSYWDYYIIGGRFSNLLIDKDGNKCNSCLLKDLDLNMMVKRNKEHAEQNWEEAIKSKNQILNVLIYGIKNDETKESYVIRNSNFETYAVVTPDGKWNSAGTMGWFGMSSESDEEAIKWSNEFYNSFIKDANKNLRITIVDCHI